MNLLDRLDLVGVDDRWRKPRTGVCFLCGDPILTHPTLRHRFWAVLALIIR